VRRSLAGLLLVAALSGTVAGCGGGGASDKPEALTVVVDAPFARSAYLGQGIADAVQLAFQGQTPLRIGSKSYNVRVLRLDNGQSPSRAVGNVRRAIREHAVAIVSDGTGVNATWQLAAKAGIPICIVFDGDGGLVDPATRPNVFRIAPTNHGISFRLAEYLIPKGLKVVFLTDDTGYGRGGRAALDHAFEQNRSSVAARIEIPSTATDLAPQVLQARRSGATALLVWAEPAAVAEVVIAARSSGWRVPIYSAPSAEDPLVRQELAGHPDWLDGLTFASGRMTAEVGAGPFLTFQSMYRDAFGLQKVGVKGPSGKPVVSPPDYAMYPYDFARVLVAALQAAKGVDGEKLLAKLNEVSIQGANGDQRGFSQNNHDGVVDDDVYFARFEHMVYVPVKDDPLSRTLPAIPQDEG
jgi:ABC-type branched-subunit amino acid transport system substrate-binding protein